MGRNYKSQKNMFDQKILAILQFLPFIYSAGLFKNSVLQPDDATNPFMYKRYNEDLVGLSGFDEGVVMKRSFSQQDMCERTSAMFAIRACRAYCIKNYDSYPSECGVPGAAT